MIFTKLSRQLGTILAVATLVLAMGGRWSIATDALASVSAPFVPAGQARPSRQAQRDFDRTPVPSWTEPDDPERTAASQRASPSPPPEASPAVEIEMEATSAGSSPGPVSSPGPPDAPAPPAKRSSHRDLAGKLNLNDATPEQLMLLPTVGPSKAERIVIWRKKNGGFRRIADLRRVKGFGYRTFKKLEPFLAVAGETTLVAK